jgi:hypothetical protein
MHRGSIETAVVVFAVLVAGCSSSGGGSAKGNDGGTSTTRATSASTSSSVASTTTTQKPTTDRALAASAVLTLADLPAGWTAKPYVASSAPALERDLATCLNVPISAIDTDLAPHADSDEFSQPGAGSAYVPTLNNGVAIYPSAAKASVILDTAGKPNFPSCTAKGLANELRRQGLDGVSASAKLLPIARIGDRSIAIQALLMAGPVTSQVDLLFAQHGRSIAFIVSGSGLGPADPKLEAALLAKVVARLGASAR